MLHFKRPSASLTGTAASEDSNMTASAQAVPPVNVSCVNALSTSIPQTARVDVYDSHGVAHTLRALLDSGSEANFIIAKSALVN